MSTATVILSGAPTRARWRSVHVVVGQPASLRAWSRDLTGTIQPAVELTVAGVPAWWHDPEGALARALSGEAPVDVAAFGVLSSRLVVEDHAERLLGILVSSGGAAAPEPAAAPAARRKSAPPEPAEEAPAPEPESAPEPAEEAPAPKKPAARRRKAPSKG